MWRIPDANTNADANSHTNTYTYPDANSGRGVTEQHTRSTSYSNCG